MAETPGTSVIESVKGIAGIREDASIASLIGNVEEVMIVVARAADIALRVNEELQNEEIRGIYQVKDALHQIVLVTEKGYAFLDKVHDVLCYCHGDSIREATEELRRAVSTPQKQERRGLRLVKELQAGQKRMCMCLTSQARVVRPLPVR